MERAWRESEYLGHLWGERRRFAWVMRRYGGLTQVAAELSALRRYPYERADAPQRGLIFHDEAWHWAMLRIHGDLYARERPGLATPPAEYRELELGWSRPETRDPGANQIPGPPRDVVSRYSAFVRYRQADPRGHPGQR